MGNAMCGLCVASTDQRRLTFPESWPASLFAWWPWYRCPQQDHNVITYINLFCKTLIARITTTVTQQLLERSKTSVSHGAAASRIITQKTTERISYTQRQRKRGSGLSLLTHSSGGVRARFRVWFQVVKVPIFGGFPVENPTNKATASKLF